MAIVVHAIYPGDPRVRRQSDALTDAGYEVDVFALRQPGEAADETDGAQRIVRLPLNRLFSGFAGHLAEYVGIHRDGRLAPRARASSAPIRPRAGRHGAGLPRRCRPAREARRRAAPARPPRGHARVLPRPLPRAGAAAPHAPRHRRGARLRGRRRRAHHRPRAVARALDRARRAARQDHGRHELGGPAAVRSLSTSATSLHGRRDAPADPPLQPPAHLRPGSGHRWAVCAAGRSRLAPGRLRRRSVAWTGRGGDRRDRGPPTA